MVDKFPLVTVFICTFNKFNYLSEALNSLFVQDYPNIELIISDDGSPNFDLRSIDKLVLNPPENIKTLKIIHHKENLGTVKNLNNILKEGRGEYFIGLAPDDLFYRKTSISEVVNYFLDTGAMVVTTKRKVFDTTLKKQKGVLPNPKDCRYLQKSYSLLFERLCINNFISGASTYHSRELFEKYGNFDERYILLEDQPKYLELARRNVKIHFYNEITKLYRWGGISTSKVKNPILLEDARKTFEHEVLPYINKKNQTIYRIALFNYEMYRTGKKFKFEYLIRFPDALLYKVLYQIGSLNL